MLFTLTSAILSPGASARPGSESAGPRQSAPSVFGFDGNEFLAYKKGDKITLQKRGSEFSDVDLDLSLISFDGHSKDNQCKNEQVLITGEQAKLDFFALKGSGTTESCLDQDNTTCFDNNKIFCKELIIKSVIDDKTYHNYYCGYQTTCIRGRAFQSSVVIQGEMTPRGTVIVSNSPAQSTLR